MTTTPTPPPKPADVAAWMLKELTEKKSLYQESTVYKIKKMFGDPFYYKNENGNYAISKEVLKEFKKLTLDDVVWDKSDRRWRFRKASDDPSKREVED